MHLVSGSFSLACAAAVAALTPSASAQCVTGGGGGSFPGAGAVTGTWDATLPTNPSVSTLSVTVPGGATVLKSVVLNGLSHTYNGDVHVVLQNPAGAKFNVLVMSDSTSPTGGGCFDAFGGTYTIIDPVAGACSGVQPIGCTSTGATLPTGTYTQNYSTWTSGNAGLSNTGLESIPISSGTWTLEIYDWYPPADNGTLTSFDLCFGSPFVMSGGTPMTCVGAGAGGSYPTAGTAGVWPTTMPTGQLSSSLSVTVPGGSTKILAVKVNGWSHTWYDDTQIVLQSPSGVLYNVLQANDNAPFGTCGDQISGDYVFVDATNGLSPCGGPASAPVGCGAGIPAGTYKQSYGTWPSGSSSINNVDLESIPVASGTWTLHFYDWYIPADTGSITSWELCFDVVSAPVSYCTAGTTTNGCLASISANNNPSVSFANSCNITVTNVEGQKNGILFYGLAGNSVPWASGSNSFLCVKPPTQRTGTQSSGGTVGACDGTLSLDWNAFQTANPTSLGNPWSPGDKAYVQAWFRDPAAVKTTNLSNGLEMTYVP